MLAVSSGQHVQSINTGYSRQPKLNDLHLGIFGRALLSEVHMYVSSATDISIFTLLSFELLQLKAAL